MTDKKFPRKNDRGSQESDNAGLKKTPIRLEILKRMQGGHKLFSVEELHSSLKKGTADLVTVYRCIRKFEEAGLVTSVALGDGALRYEIRAKGTKDENSVDRSPHHHLVCRICHIVKVIKQCSLRSIPAAVKKMGFSDLGHRLDFFGICPSRKKAL